MNYSFKFRIVILFIFGLTGFRLALYAQNYDCEEELFSKKDKSTRLFGYVNAIGEYRVPPTFLKAFPFVGRNAVVQQGKMFGVINCEGRLVVPADYEQITGFTNGKGWVRRAGLWGLADDKGRLLIQPMYEEVKEVNPTSGTVSWVKKSGLWGLISKENGRFLVPAKYEDVSNLSDSAGVARLNGRQDLVYYGDGRVIIQNMREMRKLQGELFAYQHDDRKWGAFNSLAYMMIRPRWDTLFLNAPLVQVKLDGKWGLLSLRGAEILLPGYQEIKPFSGGFSAVKKSGLSGVVSPSGKFEAEGLVYENAWVNGPEGTVVLSKGGKAALWNLQEKKWLFPMEYQRIFHSGKWLLLTQNETTRGYNLNQKSWGIGEWDSVKTISTNGVGICWKKGMAYWSRYAMGEVQSGPYDRIETTAGEFTFPIQNNKYGLMDPFGKLLIPVENEGIKASRSGKYFVVAKGGKKGLLDVSGNWILKPLVDDLEPTFYPKLLIVREKGKCGLSDETGKWIAEAKYDSISGQKYPGDELKAPFIGYRKGKSQLINEKGVSVTELTEGNWQNAGEGRMIHTSPKGQHLIGYDGKVQTETIFEELRPFSEANAPARIGGKWGFVNLFGKMVIPAQYEDVMPFEKGIGYAKQGGKWGVLRRNGSWLVKPVGVSVSIDSSGRRKLIMP